MVLEEMVDSGTLMLVIGAIQSGGTQGSGGVRHNGTTALTNGGGFRRVEREELFDGGDTLTPVAAVVVVGKDCLDRWSRIRW